jgi:hypothetical protein
MLTLLELEENWLKLRKMRLKKKEKTAIFNTIKKKQQQN